MTDLSHESPDERARLSATEDVPWGGSVFDSGERHGGLGVQAALYGMVAAFFFAGGIGYWIDVGDATGTVMLLLTGMVMAVISGYLAYPRRGDRQPLVGMVPGRRDGPAARIEETPAAAKAVTFEVHHAPEAKAWFPNGSIWPFTIGVGVLLFANGLLLGIWLWLPALAFVTFALLGFALQSRRRD